VTPISSFQGVADEFAPAKVLKFGPLRVCRQGIVHQHEPSAVTHKIQQAASQDLFNSGLVRTEGLEFGLLHVRVGGRYPGTGAVVHHDGVEAANVRRQIIREIIADHRLESTALGAQGRESGTAVGNAVSLVGIFGHQVGGRVPNQHPARSLCCSLQFVRGGRQNLASAIRGDLFDSPGLCSHKREAEATSEQLQTEVKEARLHKLQPFRYSHERSASASR